MDRKYRQILTGVLILADTAALFCSLSVAWWLRLGSGILPTGANFPLSTYLLYLAGLLPVVWTIYRLSGLYVRVLRPSVADELRRLLQANVLILMAAMAVLYLIRRGEFSRSVLALFLGLNTTAGLLIRRMIRGWLRTWLVREKAQRQVLVIGSGSLGEAFLRRVREGALPGHQVIAFLDDSASSTQMDQIPILGQIASLPTVLAQETVDDVVIALPLAFYHQLPDLLSLCEEHGVHTSIIPDYLGLIPARLAAESIDGLPLIDLRHFPLNDPLNRLLKRILDIIGSLVGLVLSTPLMLLIAATIRLTSAGPVLFRQERVGLNRRRFTMLKFRTMHMNNGSDTEWTTTTDQRRTRLGSLLRKASLDELPQLFNVLTGEMSLVGPRPERPYFVERFRTEIPQYMLKHLVRPGITGWAQINGWRGDTSIAERIKCDLNYIENWTLWLDLRIITLTIWRGLFNRNAY